MFNLIIFLARPQFCLLLVQIIKILLSGSFKEWSLSACFGVLTILFPS